MAFVHGQRGGDVEGIDDSVAPLHGLAAALTAWRRETGNGSSPVTCRPPTPRRQAAGGRKKPRP